MATGILVAVGGLFLVVALTGTWADRVLFDSDEFADRTVAMLQSSAVRQELAEVLTQAAIEEGESTLAAYRAEIVPVAADVIGTDGFEALFRAAVADAHQAAVQRQAGRAVLELGETVSLLASSGQVSGSSWVDQLPSATSSLLIDAGPVVDRLDLWAVHRALRWLDEVAWVVTVACFGSAIAIDRRRRLAVRDVGAAVALAGAAVWLLAVLAPGWASDAIEDPGVRSAVAAGAERFVADLRWLGLWVVAIGVVTVTAARSPGTPHVLVAAVEAARRAVDRARSGHRPTQVGWGAAMVVAAVGMVVWPDVVYGLVVVVVAASVAATGLGFVFSGLLGEPELTEADDREVAVRWRSALVPLAVLVAVTAAGGLQVAAAHRTAGAAGGLRCNGHAELCDRRLDQVALAGSHNSMSAASDAGWVFPENPNGIAPQLEWGIRALLVKSHYGTPTGVDFAGAELVVTDTAAESAANATEEASELSPEAVAQAKKLAETVPEDPSQRQLYLCHVYCELGATPFDQALADIRRFVDRNPHDVVVLFIGDYVTPADTATAVDQAGLTDRVWTYDQSKPPPTLREMIEAGRTLLVLAEHNGGDPAWYTPGYGIFQDTPFTFTDPSQFSCARNRGPANAPLFELNHFITPKGAAPSVADAQEVNAYDVLMGRARQCQQERGLLPNIVAVDFYATGDLLRVIDDLNGV